MGVHANINTGNCSNDLETDLQIRKIFQKFSCSIGYLGSIFQLNGDGLVGEFHQKTGQLHGLFKILSERHKLFFQLLYCGAGCNELSGDVT